MMFLKKADWPKSASTAKTSNDLVSITKPEGIVIKLSDDDMLADVDLQITANATSQPEPTSTDTVCGMTCGIKEPFDELGMETRLRRAKRRERNLRQRLRNAKKLGKWKKVRHLLGEYLASYDVRLAVTDDRVKRLKGTKRPALEAYPTLADEANPFIHREDPVGVRLIRKKEGSNDGRPVLSFDLPDQIAQEVLRRAMQAGLPNPSKHQFGGRGGVSGAIRTASEYFSQGYVHVVEADIRKCYANFDRHQIPACLSPIPEKVIREVLVPELQGRLFSSQEGDWFSYAPLNAPLHELAAARHEECVQARSGLPQGSAASPLASELLLAPVVDELVQTCSGKVVVYADNFLLMAKTHNEAVSMYCTLKFLLEEHPAGPLSLKLEWDVSRQRLLDHLG
jgi:hypothetical protein